MFSDDRTTFREMRTDVASFIEARDWARYHHPVNVASAAAVEAGELVELFQWRRPGDPVPSEVKAAAGGELADTLHFTLCLANALDARLDCDGLTVLELLEGTPDPEGGAKATAEEVLSDAALTLMATRAVYGPGGSGPTTADESSQATIATAIELTLSAVARCARELGLDLSAELWRKDRLNEERYPVGSRPDVGY